MDSSRVHWIRWSWMTAAALVAIAVGGIVYAGKPIPEAPKASGTGTGPVVAPSPMPGLPPGFHVLTQPAPDRLAIPAPGALDPDLPRGAVPEIAAARSIDRCLVPVPDVDSRFVVTPRVVDDGMIVAPAVVGVPVTSR